MSHVRPRTGMLSELLPCLGGVILWAAHFFGLYGAATLACLNPAARHSAPFFAFAIAFTVMAILAVLGLMAWQAARAGPQGDGGDPSDLGHFLRAVSIGLGFAALLAIVWQTLPVLVLPSCSAAAA